MSWNSHGLNTKLDDVDFVNYCKNFDIFSISEIYDCKEEKLKKVFSAYDCYVAKRLRGMGGGVAVFVLKSLENLVVRLNIDLSECICLLLDKNCLKTDKKVLLCFPYIAHESSPVYQNMSTKGIQNLESLFVELSEKYGQVEWIIGGDMNARTGLLDDCFVENNVHNYISYSDFDSSLDEINIKRNSKDPSYTNSFGKQLVNFCKENSLYILNGRTPGDEPGNITCIANKGKTIVDYFIATKNIFDEIASFKVTPRPESDHFPLSISINIKNDVEDNQFDIIETTQIEKLKWEEEKKESYLWNLENSLNASFDEFYNFIQENNVDEANDLLLECIKLSAGEMQTKTNRNNGSKTEINPQPDWWDSDCENLNKMKFFYLHEFHKSNKTDDLNLFLETKKKFKSMCTIKKKAFDDLSVENLRESLYEKRSPPFWQKMNKMLSCPYNQHNYFNVNPNEFHEYFKALLNPVSNIIHEGTEENDINIDKDINPTTELDYNDIITQKEVEIALKKLKNGKASGNDGISPEFFHNFSPTLVTFLCVLFNTIFNTGIYPSTWCQSLIFPLHKRGDQNNPNNYRGIALLNIISKIFSSILNTRLSQWAESNDLIPEAQAGFRKEYSTIDHIFSLQAIVQKYLSKSRGRFYVLFVDFSKAFDCIPRSKLWTVLQNKGLRGKMLSVLKSMYEEIKAAVRVNRCEITEYFQCMSGVRQGCTLSPLLFSMYVSELDLMLKTSNTNGVVLLTTTQME